MSTTPVSPAQSSPGSVGPFRATLDNGLRLVVVPDHSTPIVAVHLTYRVGSCDEPRGRTGFAHLFEHLMFQGSANTAPGELSNSLSETGAQPNAATYFDWTMYHEAVPVGALELALWFEADRMGGFLDVLDQKVLDTERDVVKSERRQSFEGQPFGTSWELIHAALFPEPHPYHWLPIGSMEDIDAATVEDVRSFFETHYGPNSCVLTLAGDVTPDHALELVERYFGGIPANPRIPARPATDIARGSGEIRLDAPEPGPVPACFAAFRGPALTHDDHTALELACQILGGGQASRLTDRLIRREQMVRDVECGPTVMHGDVTSVVIACFLSGAAEMAEVERIRDEEITRLAGEPPSAEELARAVAQLERALWEELSGVEGRAQFYGESEAFHAEEDPVSGRLSRLAAVTPEDVSRAVRTWLTPDNRVVLVYPGGGEDDMFDDDMYDEYLPHAEEHP